jgi:cell division protein FtsL
MTPPAVAASSLPRSRVTSPPRPRVAPPRPRRVSGPVRAPARQPVRQPAGRAAAERGLVLGALEALGTLTSHGALDRLIRGRIWIAVIAFALIGIVTLQLLVLQLNASIGRALVHEAQLQRANAAYSIEDSELAGGERVESKAEHLGMHLVAPGALRFLTSDPRADVSRAAAALNTPVRTAGSTSVSTASAATTSAATTLTSSSGVEAASSSAGTATGTSEAVTSASSEQTAGAQTPSGAQAPAGEATAHSTTPTGASPAGEAASTPEQTAPTPAGAAGGTESTGTG